MSAPTADDPFSFSLGQLSYIGASYEDESTVYIPATASQSLGWARRLLAKFAEWRHRRPVMQEMAMMTDRELSGIGLTPSDITRVFDHPAFAARRWVGQAHIGY
ncbi:MAG: DUF1127 domain-containing protein [Acetobacteraceae bacterium]